MDLIQFARSKHPTTFGAGNGWSQMSFEEFASVFLKRYHPKVENQLVHLTVRPATKTVADASMTVVEQAEYPVFLYWVTRYVTWKGDEERSIGYVEYALKVQAESIPPEMLIEFERDFPDLVVHTTRQAPPDGERIIYDWQASVDAQLYDTCYLFESDALSQARVNVQELLAVFPPDRRTQILKVPSKPEEYESV